MAWENILVHSATGTTMAKMSHYLSYDIWDGGTSHQETVLVFQENASMGPSLPKTEQTVLKITNMDNINSSFQGSIFLL